MTQSDLMGDGLAELTKAGPGGPSQSIGYFARFGVTETLIRETLAAALSRGGDYGDLFFQHRVSTAMSLEDGVVSKASTMVELGVGVRVVKGDQTGYAYTEDLTLEAMRSAARTAAAIADGPSRPGPQHFHVFKELPKRDQTGYAYTEDLTLEAMRSAARTAAAIADGPSRPGPQHFHVFKELPKRYVL